jgi:hypothetical protein
MAHHPIRVDNSRPATVQDTAKALGVSKRRTDELIREVRQMVQRDAKTGEFVIRTIRPEKAAANSRNGSAKVHKTRSGRRRNSR